MAKTLLWIYVIINSTAYGKALISGVEKPMTVYYSIWVAVGVIAICDALKKSKEDAV